jgi:phospho-N-acetylmuramoyl-pentapeptide-transferase
VVKLGNPYVWIVLGVMVVFGAVGWVDDFRKIVEKNPRRLTCQMEVFVAIGGWFGGGCDLVFLAKTPVETTLDFSIF